MATEFRKAIRGLRDELQSNPQVKVKGITTPPPMNKKELAAIERVAPQSVFAFHREMNGLTIEWELKKSADPDVKGSVKLLPVKEILKEWKGIVYFDFTPEGERIRNFHPIDFFIDEAAAGAFLNEGKEEDRSLYLFHFEGEPVRLHLEMRGYIQMMIASKGFLYWQYAVIEILKQKENPVSRRFKEWMPQLFPEFSWEAYAARFGALQI